MLLIMRSMDTRVRTEADLYNPFTLPTGPRARLSPHGRGTVEAMKGDHARITLLGNNSGRNLGDMAIMSSILESLSRRVPQAEFYVPAVNSSWVTKHYGDRYNVKAVDVMPWTLSIRLLGLPTILCLLKSDIALICDGIIFGKKLFNPAFNYLITLVFVVPIARLLGCKVVCYSCGIGPFPSWVSRLFARWVIDGSDLVMMRERDSEKLCREIGVTKPIELTGDAAFINPVSSDERAMEISNELGIDPTTQLLAVNATSYLDTWLKPEERLSDSSRFIDLLADGIRRAKKKSSTPFLPLIICTHPMDEATCRTLAELTGGKLLSNTKYLSHDIQAVIRRCGLLVGMRFHSIVLASSVETPVVGLVYAPKVRGYMRLLNCDEYTLELASLTPDLLGEKLSQAWNDRRSLQAQQVPIIRELKAGAEKAADIVAQRYFSATRAVESEAAAA
jgi:polysaccharide pyruvyl transferase WcaK-like protein